MTFVLGFSGRIMKQLVGVGFPNIFVGWVVGNNDFWVLKKKDCSVEIGYQAGNYTPSRTL